MRLDTALPDNLLSENDWNAFLVRLLGIVNPLGDYWTVDVRMDSIYRSWREHYASGL